MKLFALIFLVSITSTVCAQKTTFVRIYDLQGKKINKGHVFAVTDTSIQLRGKEAPVNISVSSIGSIKTKHSAGNNLLMGSAIGAGVLAAVGVATSNPDPGFLEYTAGEGIGAGILLGAPLGAAIGGLTILFKNSKTYTIQGDLIKWKAFESMMTGK